MKKDDSDVSKKIAMDFWGRLENAQQEAGVSIKDLCQEANVTYQTVMNQRSAGTLPSTMTILKIAHYLDKSMDWLLTGSNSPKDTQEQKLALAIMNDKKALAIAKCAIAMQEEEKDATMVILKKMTNTKS